jgi:hypothetical protein
LLRVDEHVDLLAHRKVGLRIARRGILCPARDDAACGPGYCNHSRGPSPRAACTTPGDGARLQRGLRAPMWRAGLRGFHAQDRCRVESAALGATAQWSRTSRKVLRRLGRRRCAARGCRR